MDLFFSPLACSLATRIALTEAGLDANFIEVDPLTKTAAGEDFHRINPLGLVPVLRLDDGHVLTENAAILQVVAELAPEALSPAGAHARARLRQWLNFIGTELHTGLFSCMFDDTAPAEVRAYAASRGASRLRFLDTHLAGRAFLLERFTVADAYLITILNWAQATPVDLQGYDGITAYLQQGLRRPSVEASLALELPLYLAERKRARALKPHPDLEGERVVAG